MAVAARQDRWISISGISSVGSLIFYLAYTMSSPRPWVALGYELTPDYHERTRDLMGVQNFIGNALPTWCRRTSWPLCTCPCSNDDVVLGASTARDRYRYCGNCAGRHAGDISYARTVYVDQRVYVWKRRQTQFRQQSAGAVIWENLKASSARDSRRRCRLRPFLKLCLATFLVFNGFHTDCGVPVLRHHLLRI